MKARQLLFLLIIFCVYFPCQAQFQVKRYRLSPILKEISGLEKMNDSLLVAINDGGNEQRLYFLKFNGEIQHSCYISNARNQDWEDLTMDYSNNLYIADCGNNLHDRKQFSLYKINAALALKRDSLKAEVSSYSYALKNENQDTLNFDCEAIFWSRDSLYFVPKDYCCNEGLLPTFAMHAQQKNSVAISTHNYRLNGLKRIKYRPTSSAMYGDTLAILSYARLTIIIHPFSENPKIETIKFRGLKQREAMIFASSNLLFVSAERHWLFGGPFLYVLEKK
jgi:hypothetical protein